ncbi:hypothetical protein HDV06_004830 [Boothiomyces sp. JEL0866]|nr:hypothetical protein HDV06_004830 [Boothiomyces sp. JEL0866]
MKISAVPECNDSPSPTNRSVKNNRYEFLGYDGCIASCTTTVECTHWAHYNSTCHLFKDDLLGYQTNLTTSECGYDAKCNTNSKCSNSYSNLDIANNLLYIPGNSQSKSFPVAMVIGIAVGALATTGLSIYLFRRYRTSPPLQYDQTLEKGDTIKFNSRRGSPEQSSLKSIQVNKETEAFPHQLRTVYIHNSELNNQPRLPVDTETSTIHSRQPPLLLVNSTEEESTPQANSISNLDETQPPILIN